MASIQNIPGPLRLAYSYHAGPVEYFGVAINAGSRDERKGEEGLAHFVEHTIFKGTTRRRSWHILNRMEAVGGELNAFTTKEETLIYAVFPSGHLARAIDLIADLVTGSIFPERELERERQVVAEEIDSYLDSPSECVFDDFEDMLFEGTTLGHNILGSQDTVSRFTSADCMRWVKRNYTSRRMIAFYSGPADAKRISALCEHHFANVPTEPQAQIRIKETYTTEPFAVTRRCGNHQAHTLMGAAIPGMHSPLVRPISLLINMLGGPGMNSLLNVALRERRGLVYSVDVSTALFTDIGALEIYFDCNTHDIARCAKIIDNVISRLTAPGNLTARRLEAAKKQFVGQLLISSQNRENSVMSFARQSLFDLPMPPVRQLAEEIMCISHNDIYRCLEYIEPSKLSRLTLG